MAVREFDGVDDEIILGAGSIGAIANGAYSIVVLAKPTSLGTNEPYVSLQVSTTALVGSVAESGGSGKVALQTDSEDASVFDVTVSSGSWQLFGFSKASGTVAPRMHAGTLGGTISHDDASTTVANNANSITRIEIGSSNYAAFKDARIATIALFPTALTDANWNTINSTKSSQQLADLGAVAVWDLNQTSTGTAVKDLAGSADQTSLVGTTVVTGDDPSGWTFGVTTVREFDGSDDLIALGGGSVGAICNSSYSVIALIKPLTALGSGKGIFGIQVGTSNLLGGLMHSGSSLTLYTDTESSDYPVGITADAWQILGVSKPAGTGTGPTFHRKVLGSGSWTHGTGSGTIADKTSSVTRMEIGAFQGGGFSSCINAHIAVVALFNTALSDANVESIQTTPTTQKLADLGAVGIWELTQTSTGTSVSDLVGSANQSSITGTTVIASDKPVGWTFGVSGGGSGGSVTAVPAAGIGDLPAPAVSTPDATVASPIMGGIGSFPPSGNLISSEVVPPPAAGTGDLPVPGITGILPSVRRLGALTVTVAGVGRPTGLVHTRAIGSPVLSGRTSPTGLVHVRAMGSPVVSRISGAAITVGIRHTRGMGIPTLSGRALPIGLVHTRALGAHEATRIATLVGITRA